MPPVPVWFVLAGLAVVGGYQGSKAAYKHGIKPAACFVEKVGTLGHKHCAPKQKKQPAPQSPAQN